MCQWHCVESGGWPFQRLADQLCCDVLSPVWTVRHGAAAGLRELLREQAAAAAVEAPLEDINTGWACSGNAGEVFTHSAHRAPSANDLPPKGFNAAGQLVCIVSVWFDFTDTVCFSELAGSAVTVLVLRLQACASWGQSQLPRWSLRPLPTLPGWRMS